MLVPGSEGDMTVLAHHAPLLDDASRPGVLEIGFPGGEHQRYFIRGGFAEVGPVWPHRARRDGHRPRRA